MNARRIIVVALGAMVSLWLIGYAVSRVQGGPSAVLLPSATPAPSAPERTPRPTPSPLVTPAKATIDAVLRWSAGPSSLGDPQETLTMDLQTNIPVRYTYLFVTLISPTGQVLGGCPNGVGPVCFLKPGVTSGNTFVWRGSAPKGRYTLTLLAYSYQDADAEQSLEYSNWVGRLGSNLKGNPLAVIDPHHPAILNLKRVVEVNH